MNCQTCGTPLRPRARKCSKCLRPAPPSNIPGYAVGGVGVAAAIAVVVTVIANVLVALWPVAGAALAQQASDDRDAALLDTALLAETLLTTVALLTMIVAGVFVIVWLYRARANLDKLGVTATGPGRGWAIGGWFVPFANLVIPFRVMAAVVRGSLPRSGRLEAMLWIWWLAWAGGTVLDQILTRIDTADYEALPTPVLDAADFEAYVGYHQEQLLRFLPGGFFSAVAGILLVMLILRVGRGQEEQLSRRPSVPIEPGMTVPAPIITG